MTIPHLHRLPLAVAVALGCAAMAVAQGPEGAAALNQLQRAVIDAVARAEPSVVAIARVRRTDPNDLPPEADVRPDVFEGLEPLPAEPDPTDPSFIPNEYGTGVIIDPAGLILTAHHVLAEDSEYYVTTHERKVYRATVKAADPRIDLAVLAIDATDLKPITLGDGSAVRRGQFVVALGNPYAIARDGQASASWGIVSNIARKAPPAPSEHDPSGRSTLHHFGTLIQTDLRLNLGTSGGPLLDLEGRMVGLCVALAAVAGYDTDAGYAIPVNRVFRRALDRLKQGREVEYGFLGIRPTNLAPQETYTGLHGTRVSEVVRGTPADRFGLRRGDVIRAVDGNPIHDTDGLYLEVGKLPVDATTRLSVLRDRRPRTVEVRLTKYPVRGHQVVTNAPPAWRGLRVDYISAWGDRPGGLPQREMAFDRGVIVTDVADDSPAAAAGLKPGMLITKVGDTRVHRPAEFRAALANLPGPVRLSLAEEDDSRVVAVPPPDNSG